MMTNPRTTAESLEDCQGIVLTKTTLRECHEWHIEEGHTLEHQLTRRLTPSRKTPKLPEEGLPNEETANDLLISSLVR